MVGESLRHFPASLCATEKKIQRLSQSILKQTTAEKGPTATAAERAFGTTTRISRGIYFWAVLTHIVWSACFGAGLRGRS
mmetsp:Transcript_13267/g.26186  ORF Transcript_13267/g.26186 Transcript_13267/m.26186 type:complete len:80 (-) Transcript_13267:603-842(-)